VTVDARSAEMARRLAEPPSILIGPIVRAALLEDLGRAGDVTTDAIVAPDDRAVGHLVARGAGRIAGLGAALLAFRLLDPEVRAEVFAPDGTDARPGELCARLSGQTRALLGAERTALNLFGRLCGIATATQQFAARIAGTRARITCTRKTTPGLRVLEKYAVRVGGGVNHRFGLDDAVLIKDNHIIAAGGIHPALERVRESSGHMVKVEVEVDTLEQLAEALEGGADVILLDNMLPAQLREAVAMTRRRAVLEASGGVTLENVAEIAATGVDVISVGWITHSAPALDVALDFI